MITFIWNFRKGKIIEKKADQQLPWGYGWGRGEGMEFKGAQKNLGMMQLFYIVIVVEGTWLYTIMKIHQTVHLKRVNFSM